MDVEGDQDFAKWLRELGQGSFNDQNDDVILPRSLRCNVYRAIHTSHPDDYLTQRCILAPRDGEVHEINKFVLERFPGPLHDAWLAYEAYKSQTKTLFEDIAIEDLHIISPPIFPLARLSLGVGCTGIFLRDVSGAYKGSRGTITSTYHASSLTFRRSGACPENSARDGDGHALRKTEDPPSSSFNTPWPSDSR
ncbi:hypothetical protein EDB87DRAFT_348257 [Lactarius vividus]|nr:hypothetical protein EDB87DRAFT_348257 [Lactarius vividus]